MPFARFNPCVPCCLACPLDAIKPDRLCLEVRPILNCYNFNTTGTTPQQIIASVDPIAVVELVASGFDPKVWRSTHPIRLLTSNYTVGSILPVAPLVDVEYKCANISTHFETKYTDYLYFYDHITGRRVDGILTNTLTSPYDIGYLNSFISTTSPYARYFMVPAFSLPDFDGSYATLFSIVDKNLTDGCVEPVRLTYFKETTCNSFVHSCPSYKMLREYLGVTYTVQDSINPIYYLQAPGASAPGVSDPVAILYNNKNNNCIWEDIGGYYNKTFLILYVDNGYVWLQSNSYNLLDIENSGASYIRYKTPISSFDVGKYNELSFDSTNSPNFLIATRNSQQIPVEDTKVFIGPAFTNTLGNGIWTPACGIDMPFNMNYSIQSNCPGLDGQSGILTIKGMSQSYAFNGFRFGTPGTWYTYFDLFPGQDPDFLIFPAQSFVRFHILFHPTSQILYTNPDIVNQQSCAVYDIEKRNFMAEVIIEYYSGGSGVAHPCSKYPYGATPYIIDSIGCDPLYFDANFNINIEGFRCIYVPFFSGGYFDVPWSTRVGCDNNLSINLIITE